MQASALVRLGMTGLAVLVAVGFVWAYGEACARSGAERSSALARALLGAALWMALAGGLAASGMLARFDLTPPPMAFMFVACIGLGVGLGMSRVGGSFARALPLAWLVGAQGFRLPLELVMHQAAREGVMPHEMSFSGYNFDIVTGATALLVAGLLLTGRAPRALVLAWNLLGTALLAGIAIIALLASPMLHVFGTDPAHVNSWVLAFPYVWLPAVLVTSAVFGHVVVFRALARVPARSPSASLHATTMPG
jgi:hypothetical protein